MSSKSEFARHTGVSRETLEKFELYEATLRKWNGTINLVARSTLDELWTRHFLDSASAFKHQSKYTGNIKQLVSVYVII